jgi:hypothetical protein
MIYAQGTHQAPMASLMADDLFPTGREKIDPEALSFEYRMEWPQGIASIAKHGSPPSAVHRHGSSWQAPIITIHVSYELHRASTRTDEAWKVRNAKRAIRAKEEEVFCYGSAQDGVCGTTNATGVASIPRRSDAWLLRDGREPVSARVSRLLHECMFVMRQSIIARTMGEEAPTDCLLPPNLYAATSSLRRGSGLTLHQYLSKRLGVRIRCWPILLNAGRVKGSALTIDGPGSEESCLTRILMYRKHEDVLHLVRAKKFTRGEPESSGGVRTVTCHSRIGGAVGVRAAAVAIMDGC